MALTTHSHLAPRLKKELTYTSTPTLGLRGLFYGDFHVYSFIHTFISFEALRQLHNLLPNEFSVDDDLVLPFPISLILSLA